MNAQTIRTSLDTIFALTEALCDAHVTEIIHSPDGMRLLSSDLDGIDSLEMKDNIEGN
jgi:hypothetical protein